MRGWNHLPQPWYVRPFVNEVENNGWQIDYFLIRYAQLGNVLAILARHNVFGALFDVRYIDYKNPGFSDYFKITHPIIYNANLSTEIESTLPFNVAFSDDPLAHHKYYRNPAHLSAFNFLDAVKKSCLISEISDSTSIRDFQYETYKYSRQLPVVVRAINPGWTDFQWGTQSILGENKWLHPLA